MRLDHYGNLVKEKTPEQLAKECSIINVMREREQCAKIAEQMGCEAVATAIRAQSEDFTTVGEMMEGKQDA